MIIRISLLFIPLHHVLSSTFTTKCFFHNENHGISNSYSIAELFRVTVGDCLNYCIINAAKMGDGCASVVYHKSHSTCQLYGHNGSFNGSEVVPAKNHDHYERISWVGVCQDRVVPRRGYKQRPRQYAAMTDHSQEPIDVAKANNLVEFQPGQRTATADTTTTTEVPSVFTNPNEVGEALQDKSSTAVYFLNPTHSSECQKGEKVSYFVIFGHRLQSRNVTAQLKGVDQSSCVMYCTQNIDARGDSTPCYSANYEPIEEMCYLYGKRSMMGRNAAQLAMDGNYIFADKFCVQTRKDCSAETPYIVYPSKQMHRKIIVSYPGMNSVVACIAACIDNARCKAVTYKTGLCILHGASPASDSALLIDGNEQTMVIENGCQLTTETVPSLLSNNIGSGTREPQWEEWSPCQLAIGGKMVRVRQRQCSSCEDLQIETC